MIEAKFNTDQFLKEMQGIVEYSEGFLEGAKQGKTELLNSVGKAVVEGLKQFIDTNARINPQALHHVYEWYQTGSPASRLFEIEYISNNMGLSFNSTFTQSTSVRRGSKIPFYNKAAIMENGIPVVIVPRSRKPLVFESNGETVFTKAPVIVNSPGGDSVAGSYQKIFDLFFDKYFSQSFLQSSGLLDHLKDPTPFKKNFAKAKDGGRSFGMSIGYRWVAKSSGGVL
jgi:hypothetical protein